MAKLAERITPLLEPGEHIEAVVQTAGELGTISGPRMLAEFAIAHQLDPVLAALGRDGGFVVLTGGRLLLLEDQFGPSLVVKASCPRDEARIQWWETSSAGSTIRHLYLTLTGGAWAYQLVLTRGLFLRRGAAGDADRLLARLASEKGEPAQARLGSS